MPSAPKRLDRNGPEHEVRFARFQQLAAQSSQSLDCVFSRDHLATSSRSRPTALTTFLTFAGGFLMCLPGFGLLFIVARGSAQRSFVPGPNQGHSYPRPTFASTCYYFTFGVLLLTALFFSLIATYHAGQALWFLSLFLLPIAWGVPAMYCFALPFVASKQ